LSTFQAEAFYVGEKRYGLPIRSRPFM
jgi:hypothetical protein